MSRKLEPNNPGAVPVETLPEEVGGVPVLRVSHQWQLNDYVVTLQWSPDSRSIAAGLGQGSISLLRLLNADSQSPLIVDWQAHATALATLRWSPDSRRLVSGGQDGGGTKSGLMKIWEVPANDSLTPPALIQQVQGGAFCVEHVEYAPDGSALATGSGKHLKVWDPEGKLTDEFTPLNSSISGLKWRGSNQHIATSAYGGVSFWQRGTNEKKRLFEWKDSLISLEISPNGQWLAAGCQERAVHIWRVNSGEDFEMSGYPNKVRAVAWSSDNRYLVTTGGEHITIWDFKGKGPAGTRPLVRTGHVDYPVAFAFRPGSMTQFASIGRDGAFFIWDLGLQEKPTQLGFRMLPATTLAWSPDGSLLATGYENGDLCVWTIR